MKPGFELVDSHGLQTDLHISTDFSGSLTSISVIIPSGKSDKDLMDLFANKDDDEEDG